MHQGSKFYSEIVENGTKWHITTEQSNLKYKQVGQIALSFCWMKKEVLKQNVALRISA